MSTVKPRKLELAELELPYSSNMNIYPEVGIYGVRRQTI